MIVAHRKTIPELMDILKKHKKRGAVGKSDIRSPSGLSGA